MTAKVTLFLTNPEDVITVPDEAIIKYNGSADVYKLENGIAKITPVTISRSMGAKTIITAGLVEGDTIVTVGQKQLGLDSKVWIEKTH